MTATPRSSGAHGPWNVADTSVSMDGSYDGPGPSVTGEVTLAGLGAIPGDVVNVWLVATKVSTGGLITVNPRSRGHRHNKRRR